MLTASVVSGVEGEVKDYQDQLKQMLQDLAKEKEKDVEKPLPLMNQVLGTCCSATQYSTLALRKTSSLSAASPYFTSKV